MGGSPSGQTTITIEWTLAALALAFVLLRLWVRVMKLRSRLLWADHLVLAGWIVLAGAVTCDTLVYLEGGMLPDADVTTIILPERLMKISFAGSVLFYLGLLLPRFSIAAFYFSLFPEGTALRKALYMVIVYMGFCALTILLVLFCFCTPLSTNWTIGPDYCSVIAAKEPFTLFWAITLGCDVALFILPFFLLRRLTLRRSQRFGLVGIFLVGLITIVVSIARYCAIESSKMLTTVCIWSTAEFACSIIVVCLPNLKIFLHGAVSILRHTDHSRGTDNQNPSPPHKPNKKGWPFSDLFSSHDRDSTLRENRSTISTRFSSIVDQFVNRQSDPPPIISSRAPEDSPIISSFNKDIRNLFEADSGHNVSNIELSTMDRQQQESRRPSELTIFKTNDLQLDVHIHNENGGGSCERRGSEFDTQRNSPPCTTVEYVPGGKTPFETKIWV